MIIDKYLLFDKISKAKKFKLKKKQMIKSQ